MAIRNGMRLHLRIRLRQVALPMHKPRLNTSFKASLNLQRRLTRGRADDLYSYAYAVGYRLRYEPGN